MFPGVPSISEFLPDYDASVWFGVAARKQTPARSSEPLNKEINAGLNDPTINARIVQLGGIPMTGSPAAFEKIFISDLQKWAKVMKAANIRQE